MKKTILVILMFTMLTGFTSAADINFFKQGDSCHSDGPLNGGNLAGWGIQTADGGPYGTLGINNTYCLVMEPEQCAPIYHTSGVAVNPVTLTNKITVRYFNGPIEEDNFFMTITNSSGNNPKIISYIISDGSMTWQNQTFDLPEVLEAGKSYYLRFEHIGEIGGNCSSWGQVPVSGVDFTFENIPMVPEFSIITLILAFFGAVTIFSMIRK